MGKTKLTSKTSERKQKKEEKRREEKRREEVTVVKVRLKGSN